MVNSGDTNDQEKQHEEYLEKVNNRLLTTIAAKVYSDDKGQFIQKAADQGRTAAGQIAYMMRKFNRGELLTPDQAQDNSKELEQLRSDYEALQDQYQGLEQRFNDLQERSQGTVKELNDKQSEAEQLKLQIEQIKEEWANDLKKTHESWDKAEEEKDREIERLKKELKEEKDRADQKETKRKSAAGKRQDLEQRLQEANTWISNNTGGVFEKEYPGQF